MKALLKALGCGMESGGVSEVRMEVEVHSCLPGQATTAWRLLSSCIQRQMAQAFRRHLGLHERLNPYQNPGSFASKCAGCSNEAHVWCQKSLPPWVSALAHAAFEPRATRAKSSFTGRWSIRGNGNGNGGYYLVGKMIETRSSAILRKGNLNVPSSVDLWSKQSLLKGRRATST